MNCETPERSKETVTAGSPRSRLIINRPPLFVFVFTGSAFREFSRKKIPVENKTPVTTHYLPHRHSVPDSNKTPDHYAHIARCYDALCALGSLGAVGRCKLDVLRIIKPGDAVLFAGAGTGGDAIAASRAGAKVTVAELSPAMIARFRKKPGAENIRVVAGDILVFDADEKFDAVVANFFLNVFPPETMREVLAKLARATAPGGRLVIGDVRLPEHGFARAFTLAYWFGATRLFRVLTANAVHPVYDYEEELRASGFVVRDGKARRLLGAPCFVSLVAERWNDSTGQTGPGV